MNKLYGFRLAKSFTSDENWFKINQYGGQQLILWSLAMMAAGIAYLFMPGLNNPSETFKALLAVGPMVVFTTIAVIKTILYAKALS